MSCDHDGVKLTRYEMHLGFCNIYFGYGAGPSSIRFQRSLGFLIYVSLGLCARRICTSSPCLVIKSAKGFSSKKGYTYIYIYWALHEKLEYLGLAHAKAYHIDSEERKGINHILGVRGDSL